MASKRSRWSPVLTAWLSILHMTYVIGVQDITYYILEELPQNTRIGDVAIDSKIDQDFEPDVLAGAEYKLVESDWNVFFDLESQTGLLRVADRLDRDNLCPGVSPCVVTLEVIISSAPNYYQFLSIHIHINDTNDNAPKFSPEVIHLAVTEGVPVGSSYSLPLATDDDEAPNAITSYRLQSPSSMFSLLQNTDDLQLVVDGELDREAVAGYTITIEATDLGDPSLKGYLLVNVTVDDTNDNKPVFDQSTYRVQIPENQQVGSSITQVHAADLDHGQNGAVRYNFQTRTDERYGQLFRIDSITGILYLKSSVDYATTPSAELTVEARDQGPASLITRTQVLVEVLDINDNAPSITVTSLSSSGRLEVLENSDFQTYVAHISVSDLDSGENGEVSCSLTGSGFELLDILNNKYVISTTVSADREVKDEYAIQITCRDGGNPPLTENENLVVHILDENDNSPIFSQSVYQKQVLESATIGSVIVNTHAVDDDLGDNAKVEYSLRGEDSKYFKIFKESGDIYLYDYLDYELGSSLNFDVVATDHGSPNSLSSTALISITLIDENDNTPIFAQADYEMEVEEGLPIGTIVGLVTATDDDESPNNVIDYGLHGGADSFTIDRVTGQIRTRAVLDRELKSVYQLVLTASNEGFPGMITSTNVVVTVTDVNDNAPEVTHPMASNTTEKLSTLAPLGFAITHIEAKDPDNGVNGTVSYFILVGNGEGFFSLDENTGVLSVAKTFPDIEDFSRTFELQISIRDRGVPVHRSTSFWMTLMVDHAVPGPLTADLNSQTSVIIGVLAATVLMAFILILAIIIIRRRGRAQGHDGDRKNSAQDDSPVKIEIRNPRLGSEAGDSGLESGESANNSDTVDAKTQYMFGAPPPYHHSNNKLPRNGTRMPGFTDATQELQNQRAALPKVNSQSSDQPTGRSQHQLETAYALAAQRKSASQDAVRRQKVNHPQNQPPRINRNNSNPVPSRRIDNDFGTYPKNELSLGGTQRRINNQINNNNNLHPTYPQELDLNHTNPLSKKTSFASPISPRQGPGIPIRYPRTNQRSNPSHARIEPVYTRNDFRDNKRKHTSNEHQARLPVDGLSNRPMNDDFSSEDESNTDSGRGLSDCADSPAASQQGNQDAVLDTSSSSNLNPPDNTDLSSSPVFKNLPEEYMNSDPNTWHRLARYFNIPSSEVERLTNVQKKKISNDKSSHMRQASRTASSENLADDATTTSGSYVVDLNDLDDVMDGSAV